MLLIPDCISGSQSIFGWLGKEPPGGGGGGGGFRKQLTRNEDDVAALMCPV